MNRSKPESYEIADVLAERYDYMVEEFRHPTPEIPRSHSGFTLKRVMRPSLCLLEPILRDSWAGKGTMLTVKNNLLLLRIGLCSWDMSHAGRQARIQRCWMKDSTIITCRVLSLRQNSNHLMREHHPYRWSPLGVMRANAILKHPTLHNYLSVPFHPASSSSALLS